MKRVVLGLLSFVLVFHFLGLQVVTNASEGVAGMQRMIGEDFMQDMERITISEEDEQRYVSDEVIVTIKHEHSGINKRFSENDFPGVNISEIEYLTPLTNDTENELINYGEYKQILCLHLATNGGQNVFDAIEVLDSLSIVEIANPNYIISLEEPIISSEDEIEFEFLHESNSELLSDSSDYNLPNDPYVTQQLGAYLVQCPIAWKNETGSSSVKVGIVDSGIASHVDLNDNVILGYDYLANNPIYYGDTVGHGTMVAGIIGAVGNNATGISGVAWDVSLVPLRVLDSSGASSSSIIRAIQDAEVNGIQILNMSLGRITSENSNLKDAIRNYNGLVVCAAGNDGVNTDLIGNSHYPSCLDCDNIISVASIKNSGNLASFSNYGVETVDLAAPGVNVYTTCLNNSYTTGHSGTSFSAPFVSGAAALLLSRNSDLSAGQMKKAILDSVIPLPDYTDKLKSGGRLDVNAALSMVMKDRVKNYKMVAKFANNTGTIFQYNLDINYNQELLKFHNYSIGTITSSNNYCLDEYNEDTKNRKLSYYAITNCMDSEGVLAEFRFNCPFETENCLNTLVVDDETIQMWNVSPYPDTSFIKVLMGDVNFDNTVDASDSLLILQSTVQLETLSDAQKVAADVNEDGEVDSEDSQLILKYITKQVGTFW